MLFLDQLFKIYLNKTMSRQALNILESEIEILNMVETKCQAKISCIEVPQILNCHAGILSHFYLVYYPLDIFANRIAFYLFKKSWDTENNKFMNFIGTCHKSFIIDFMMPCSYHKNWKNINDGLIPKEEIQIMQIEEHNIKLEDYTNYISIFKTPHHKDFLAQNFWGETLSQNNIDWIMTLEGIVKKNYTGQYEEDDTPEFFSFEQNTLNQIYYPTVEESDKLYEYTKDICTFKCDYCNYYFGKNQHEKNVWHNSSYGDICISCYRKIRKDYSIRLGKSRKNILLRARKKLFKLELEITKRILNQINIPELSLEKKFLIHKKVLAEIQRDKIDATCGICLDVLDKNIEAGKCGHCFHSSCLDQMVGQKCPLCRSSTEFFKLHL